VHFLLRHDSEGEIRFAPLQGALAQRALVQRGRDPARLDTVYVLADWQAAGERLLERSRAVLHVVARLGGGWRLAAVLAALAPTALADLVYGFIARRRYRLFGRYDACPLPRPEWRDRFLE
jgi:predicted DCC family thiol-disulfide oxidoreductase YuxK